MKKIFVPLLLAMLVIITGCTSESGNSSSISNQTISEKQLQTINCRVFDAIDRPMSNAIITISYDPSKYSDGFIPGRNDSFRNTRTDENGNFSISLNRSIQYNFTISESDFIPKRNPYSYSTMLIPLNNECILKPTFTALQPDPAPETKSDRADYPSAEELNKQAGDASNWFANIVHDVFTRIF
ncbi:MAG TPA: carboxypeptidase-like regulatory domain-containing protein [Methanoregula sp.]|nr:carboxypeptidase-like regulatory domain-containing protein [Methanoregula sp.]